MPLREDERLMVLAVACGSADNNADYQDDRRRAVEAHHRVIKEPGYLQSPEGRFMSEIDSPCPDLMLRSRYRTALLHPETK
jgi:hypothetical protein